MISESLAKLEQLAAVGNPFPGLRTFDLHESHLFFGREGQSEALRAKLQANHFVAVVGASGSGKSSLVRAGLVPGLLGGLLPRAGARWRVGVLRPGSDPLLNLARALNSPDVYGPASAAQAEAQIAVTLDTLRRGKYGLCEAVSLSLRPPDENLLVVVDQFEELFRFAQYRQSYRNDAAAFVKLLLEAVKPVGPGQFITNIFVVLTMRSDFLGDCAQFYGLPEAISESQYLIPRLERDQFRAAIEGPVAVGGGRITPRLVNLLLNELSDNQDQLPILQHALMRTWEECHQPRHAHGAGKGELDLCCYQQIGGMAAALSQHADEAFNALPTERHRQIAARVFKALTEKGADNREIRRPAPLGELALIAEASEAEVSTVIEEFRQPGRTFLMPPREAQEVLQPDTLIDISHESLIRVWKSLRQWVNEEAESAAVYRRLAETARLWQRQQAGLFRSPDLQIARAWQRRERPNAAWAQRYQIAGQSAPDDFAQALRFLARSWQFHWGVRAAALLLLLIGGWLVFNVWRGREQTAAALRAKAQAEASDRKNALVVRQYSELLYDESDLQRTFERFQEAYNFFLQTQNPDGAAVAQANLAEAYWRTRQYDKVSAAYASALAALRERFGPKHFYVVRTQAQWARALVELPTQELVKLAEAKERLVEVLALQREVLGETNADVADTLNDLGRLSRKMGENQAEQAPQHFQQAAQYFEQARAMHLNVYGPTHQQIAVDLNELATLRNAQEQYAEAEKLYREALALFDKLVNRPSADSANPLALQYLHQYRADICTNLAHTLLGQQKYAESVPFYQQALAANTELADLRQQRQAQVFEASQERQQAELKRAPQAKADLLASSYFNLGLGYLFGKQYIEADRNLRQALDAHAKLQLARYPGAAYSYALDLYYLGVCQRKQGQFDSAANLLQQALKEEQMSETETALALYHVALNAQELGRSAVAQTAYRQARELYEAGKDDFDEADFAQLERLKAATSKP